MRSPVEVVRPDFIILLIDGLGMVFSQR